MTIHGNTTGLAPSELKILEKIAARRVPFDVLTTSELTRDLVRVTHSTGRQSGVLVDRQGAIHFVIIGDASKLVIVTVFVATMSNMFPRWLLPALLEAISVVDAGSTHPAPSLQSRLVQTSQ